MTRFGQMLEARCFGCFEHVKMVRDVIVTRAAEALLEVAGDLGS